ncbi:MAG: hypothetical protein Q9221_005630 [Calogaya cf. arnoldii]
MPGPEIISPAGLEVDQRTQRDGDHALVAVLPQEEKITSYDNGKIIDFHDGGKHVAAIPIPIRDSGFETSTPGPRNLSSKRQTFIRIGIVVLIVIILASAIGGGLGGARIAHQRKESGTLVDPAPGTVPTTRLTDVSLPIPREPYRNTGLAVLQWTDLNGTFHIRVYSQDHLNRIRESAWENSTSWRTPWQTNIISDAVKPATPLAAAAGYPHADYDYSPVREERLLHDVTTDELFERQASSNDSQAWKDDNFSGLYRGSNSTFLAAYWNQDFYRVSQQLIVLFQEKDFANGITQGRYTSNRRTSNPWIADKFGFSQPQGSTFALCPVSHRNGRQIMLYTVDSDRNLQQHEYTISETNLDPGTVVSLTRESTTGLIVEPRSPLAVTTQDNRPLYTLDTLPECAKKRPLTHLILYTSQDYQRLILSAWNCSSGVSDLTLQIEPLQRANTTYLALAALSNKATGEAAVYIMFDAGNGPQIEKWTVSARAGDQWSITRSVNTDFSLKSLR